MQGGLENWVCTTCGVQFTESRPENSPSCCPICVDERQYIGAEGALHVSDKRLLPWCTAHMHRWLCRPEMDDQAALDTGRPQEPRQAAAGWAVAGA